MSHLGAVSLLVRDYDEAIAFFVGTLGFELSEDTDMGGGKRWVRVTPKGGQTSLLLARAATPQQVARSRSLWQGGGLRRPLRQRLGPDRTRYRSLRP
jgi:catechol 2,3-dioxygenase-like lactoylglutathione lyase family enzyme